MNSTAIGPYAIRRKIAGGGQEAVYEAVHSGAASERVALKVVAAWCAEDFLREVHLTADLRHPNIVQVYEIGQDGEWCYCAMQYLAGQRLHDLVPEGQPLPPARAAALLKQVAAALDYAHRSGAFHGMLWPGKILVDRQDYATVIGFRMRGLDVGNPRWCAPEELQSKALDARADIYALGQIAFVLLTGRHPFDRGDLEGIWRGKLGVELPSLRAWNPEVPEAVEQAVHRALAREPSDRYQRATEFAGALECLLARPSVAAP